MRLTRVTRAQQHNKHCGVMKVWCVRRSNHLRSAHWGSWFPRYRERRYVRSAARGWRGSCRCGGRKRGSWGSWGSHGWGRFGDWRRLQEIQRISVYVKTNKENKTKNYHNTETRYFVCYFINIHFGSHAVTINCMKQHSYSLWQYDNAVFTTSSHEQFLSSHC